MSIDQSTLERESSLVQVTSPDLSYSNKHEYIIMYLHTNIGNEK